MTQNDKRLPIIGLTGNSGSGKTTASSLLSAYGGYVINADLLSHEAIKKGKPAYDEIVTAFGTGVLSVDGEIDRRELGRIVFGNYDKRTLLENIIHPRVCEETYTLIEQVNSQKSKTYAFIVIDAPLLIEADMHRACDSVWVITASAAVKKARIMKRDGISAEEAAKRIRSQRKDRELQAYADSVIPNDLDERALAVKIEEALSFLFSTGPIAANE